MKRPTDTVVATSAPALGDSHNFGRRVALRGERIQKPRTLMWEWLLLAQRSPLRRWLDRAAAADGLDPHTFGFLPTLKFYRRSAREGGEVERISLTPLPAPSGARKRELAAIVGRSLALWSWLGVADLHWENLVLGLNDHGQLVLGPLDIELILADLALPTETKLLPDADPEYADICRHAAGVRRVLPYLGKPIRVEDLLVMVNHYTTTLEFLDRHAASIADVLQGVPGLLDSPLRVLLRGTGEYVRAGSEPLWPPLLGAEAEQLARSDVPYFFRLYGQPGIHYYQNRALTQLGRLPLKGDVPQLEPLLSLSRGLRSPSRQKLREDGLFTVLGAFDHPSFTGRHRDGELEVTFGARSLVVRLPDGQELRSSRNLRAFVSSVYQACRCGEVRSVFVPQVTVCRPARGTAREFLV